MNNMIESQVITQAELEYYPEVFYNHHQTAPFPARIWIPPFGDPVSLNPHPLMYRWVNVFGTAMAAYLDEHDMPGAMHRGRFDDWYPGFVDHVNNFRNTVSFLTETALYRYATPHFYTIDEFPRDKQDLRTEVYYSSPWKGGWWRLGDAVRYMHRRVDGGARYGGQESRGTAVRPLSRGPRRDRAVHQRSALRLRHSARAARPQTAAMLVEKLMIDGIEVHQATRDFTANGATYKEGDWVVLMDQPFAALVKELFDVQKYPELPHPPQSAVAEPAAAEAEAAVVAVAAEAAADAAQPRQPRRPRRQRQRRQAALAAAVEAAVEAVAAEAAAGGGGGSGGARPAAAALAQLPYDVTGWTLPMQMGVEVVAVAEPVTAETRAHAAQARSRRADQGQSGRRRSGVRVLARLQCGAARGERYSGRRRHGQLRENRQRHLRHRQRRADPAEGRRRCDLAQGSRPRRGR